MEKLIESTAEVYESQKIRLSEYCKLIEGLMHELLQESVSVHAITGRVKSADSLQRKLNKGEHKYQSIEDVTDVVGIRVITYFEDDIDQAAKIIEREFDIDWENSTDKRKIMNADRFGYLSLHYVAALSAQRQELTEYKRFCGLRFEIQIRSMLQHAWAEIEHDLGYKSTYGVPRDIRRQFSRLAGLLEIADKEFSEIRAYLNRYEKEVEKEVKNSLYDHITIDNTSLSFYTANSQMVEKLDRAIAGERVSTPLHFEKEAGLLHLLDFTTLQHIEDELMQSESIIIQFAKKWISKRHIPGARGVCLYFAALLKIAQINDLQGIVRFLENAGLGNGKEAEKMAEQLLAAYQEVYQ